MHNENAFFLSTYRTLDAPRAHRKCRGQTVAGAKSKAEYLFEARLPATSVTHLAGRLSIRCAKRGIKRYKSRWRKAPTKPWANQTKLEESPNRRIDEWKISTHVVAGSSRQRRRKQAKRRQNSQSFFTIYHKAARLVRAPADPCRYINFAHTFAVILHFLHSNFRAQSNSWAAWNNVKCSKRARVHSFPGTRSCALVFTLY